MKMLSVLVILFTSLSAFAHSLSVTDVGNCFDTAMRAAVERAEFEFKKSTIEARGGAAVKRTGRGAQLITTFALGLEQCENGESGACGSLSYDVVTRGTKPNCRVVRVTLTGEE